MRQDGSFALKLDDDEDEGPTSARAFMPVICITPLFDTTPIPVAAAVAAATAIALEVGPNPERTAFVIST